MSNSDSDFGRLSTAWSASSRPPQTSGASPSFAARQNDAVATPPGGPLVLVVAQFGPTTATDATDDELAPPADAYRLESALVLDSADLQALIELRAPRVLLIDAELCDQLGHAAVRQLRRLQPATDWMLVWPEESPRWVETLVCCQARGAVARGTTAPQLRRALRAVLGGELWFSRTMMSLLYAWLLGAALAASSLPDGTGESHTSGDDHLTEREREVLALMKQGLSNKQIGERLEISINTVKKHLAHAFEKRGLHRRRQVLG